MSPETVLVHLLIVLVAARVAAEIAERAGQAAVLLEIVLGIAIGPSLLGLIGRDDFLTALGEIGAVLLLFEVGMQMNLRELTRVGGDSLRVATIGILTPMLLAIPALRATGMSHTTALFLAGGITATSVGITARVFGDLRSLATPEARTVLGAAVADDVGGLLILTFVVAVAGGGAVSVAALATTLGIAVGFVVFVSIAVIWLAPRLFAVVSRRSRAEGTLMVLALAFSLLVARAADAAHLAPIVGAFIAGLAISGSDVRDDVQRRLGPLVQVLVPIFFLQIGIDTRIGVFSDPRVVAIAALLSVIAVAGKIAAGIGVRRGRANRLLVGVAMIPRGEVGLIFAGIGLSGRILDAQTYAMLVVVVLVTTLVTPPMVRQLIVRSRRRPAPGRTPAVDAPGQWLVVTADRVELAAEPSDLMALRLGLEAAVLCATREAGPRLVSWLVGAECNAAVWGASEREAFFHLLRSGNVRSWRLLEVTGLLTRCVPALDDAISRRKRDSFQLDPGADLRFGSLEDLRALVARRPPLPANQRALEIWDELGIKHLVFFAALAVSLFDGDPDPGPRTAELAEAIGLPAADVATVQSLVAERGLLRAAAMRMDMGTEDSILELAAHIGRREVADAAYVLAVAEGGLEWNRDRLDEQFELVRSALEHPDLAGTGDLVEARRAEIARELHHLPATEVARHLEAAPRRYLVSHSPEVVARHLRMTATPIGRFEVRLEAEPEAPLTSGHRGRWWVHVAARDRDGLLARIAWALARHEVSVHEAFVSTWADGKAIDVFRVDAPAGIDWEQARQTIAGALVHSVNGTVLTPVDGVVDVDNAASPWYTILELRAYDRTGLLWRVACALANAGLRIHAALVTTDGVVAVDVFYVTGAGGGKLDDAGEHDVRLALAGRPPRRWRPWRQAVAPEGGPDAPDTEPAAPSGPAVT